MADAQQTIELVFNGVDNTAAAVQSVLKNTKNFAGSIETATQPIADFTFAALRLEAQLIATGVAATAFSVKLAGDFDTGFREIATLIGVPLEGLQDFKQEILDYSLTSTSSLEDITSSIYTAISAGTDYAESVEFIAEAEKLATAGRASLADTSLVLASSLNAYGASTEEAGQYSAALFQTVADGLTTLPELAGSLSQVTNVAANAGVSFEELLAALAAITSTGTKTDVAVTQLRGAILAITQPTPAAAAAAKELGIAFDAEALAAGGLSGVLEDVVEATGGSSEALGELFTNSRALQGAITLTGGAADKFASSLANMEEASETLNNAWKIMTGSFDSSVQIIQNALRVFFISIGDPLLDEFQGIAGNISKIFSELADNAGLETGIGSVVKYIEEQFQEVEGTLATVAENINEALEEADFSGFIQGVNVVRAAVSEIFGGLDLSTVNGLSTAITSAGTAFQALSEFSAGVIESFKPLSELFFDIGSDVAGLNVEALRSAGAFAGYTTQLNLVSGAIVPLAAALLAVNQAIALTATTSKVAIAPVLALGAALNTASGGGLLGSLRLLGVAGLGAAVGVTLGTLANKIIEINTGLSASTRIADWVDELNIFGNSASSLVEKLEEVPDGVDDFEESLQGISDILQDFAGSDDPLFEWITGGAYDAVGSLGDVEESVLQLITVNERLSDQELGIINELEALPGVASDAAKAMDGIAEAAEGIGDEISLQEKLALIESQSAITTSNIEADADKTVAAFESISSSIESTSELLGTLYGELNEADNFRDKFRIEDQIEQENERLAAESEAQLKLLRSQLRINQAREAALRAGQALIQVDGAGLQPHLEAIMFELLEAIQVRVNSDGYALLLGVD